MTFRFLVWVLMLGAGFTSFPQFSSAESPGVFLASGWEYRWGDSPQNSQGKLLWAEDSGKEGWQPYEFSESLPGRNKAKYLWLRVKLPAGPLSHPVLHIHSVYLAFEVFLEGQVIHRFQSPSDPQSVRRLALNPQNIFLDPENLGKTLVLRFYSDYPTIGIYGPVLLGEHEAIFTHLWETDRGKIAVGAILLFLGVMSLLGFMFNHPMVLFCWFGLFALSLGVYVLNLSISRTYWGFSAETWEMLYQMFLGTGLFGVWMYILSAFSFLSPMGQKKTGYFLGGVAVLYLAFYGLNAHGLVSNIFYYFIMSLMWATLGLTALATGVLVILRAVQGSRDAKIILIGYVILAIISLHTVLVGFDVFKQDIVLHWGVLPFVLSMGLVVLVRVMGTRSELQKTTREVQVLHMEKEQMLRDMHDGLGGLNTNILLLAETARRKNTLEEINPILASIIEVAMSSMHELRGLMNSLDTGELSWSHIFPELRRHGKNMLEPHEIQLEFIVNVSGTPVKASSLAYVNVFRFFNEAISNIIKHARASHTQVEMTLTKSRLKMKISDNGQGLSENFRSKGRGSNNFIKRAEKLGGKVEISSNMGTTVILELPLPLEIDFS